MEEGLTASFEKIVLDVEMLQMMAVTMAPAGVDQREIDEVSRPPSPSSHLGHFFGLSAYPGSGETVFYEPPAGTGRTTEAEAAGSVTAGSGAMWLSRDAPRALRAASLDPRSPPASMPRS